MFEKDGEVSVLGLTREQLQFGDLRSDMTRSPRGYVAAVAHGSASRQVRSRPFFNSPPSSSGCLSNEICDTPVPQSHCVFSVKLANPIA